MKTLITLVAATFTFMLTSCSKPAETGNPGLCENDSPFAHNTALSTAIDDIKRRDSFLLKYGIVDPRVSFLVSKYDLYRALGIKEGTPSVFDYIRVYRGRDTADQAKLYITPVVGADPCRNNGGNDTVLVGTMPDGSRGPMMLDLNYPCPSMCPNNKLSDMLSKDKK